MTRPSNHHDTARGFTLVEILIVVVILGILAAIVIPQFSDASNEARENTLKDELRYLRTQLEVFAAQHNDRNPGYDSTGSLASDPAARFIEQLTKPTSAEGNPNATASDTYKFGPYISRMPANPLNSLETVKTVTTDAWPSPDGLTGWMYNPKSRKIVANLAGSDSDGTSYLSY